MATLLIAVAMVAWGGLPVNAQQVGPAAPAMTELLDVQKAIQANLDRLEQATVCLQAGGGSGSGVIVNADGLILTAAHVVEGKKTMTVRFRDNRTVTCKVLGTYGPADAAMAQIIEDGPYIFADVAPAGSLQNGDTVFALGHPSGFDLQRGMPLRLGHVTSSEENFFANDAALIKGDSGGPGFNVQGQVVGIHSNISGDTVTTNNDTHIDAFHRHWNSMLAGVRKGRTLEPENAPDLLVVGLRLIANQPGEPIEVDRVVPNTPADWAGLNSGDSIASVNGKVVTNAGEFMTNAKKSNWGRTLKLAITRDNQPLELTIKLMTYDEVQARKEELQKGTDDVPEDEDEDGKNVEPLWYQPPAEPADGESEPKSELQRLVEEARKNGGRLKIDPAKLRALNNRLSKRVDKLSPVGGRLNDSWAVRFRQAFQATANRYAETVYPVMVTGRVSAVATAVGDQGYFVTKASEIEGRKFQIVLCDESRVDATQVAVDRDNDLALLKIDPGQHRIESVDLAKDSAATSPKGTVCCCVNHKQDYLAGFGIVSVAERPLNGDTGAALGLNAKAVPGGLQVVNAAPGLPAQAAGLKPDDVITHFGDEALSTVADLEQLIQKHLPEDEVRLAVKRGESLFSVAVVLGHRSRLAPMAGRREQSLDKVSAKLSRRRWGFDRGIQHDGAIGPADCGGLLIDLHGKIVGLNIARAGRIKSYAIPAHVVQKFVEQGIADHSRQTAVQTQGATIR